MQILKETFKKLKTETLPKLGIRDKVLNKILSYRLIIERLGEEDNNNWWESSVLSKFGRDSLKEVTPRAMVKNRITLAQKVGKKKEQELINEKSPITLFYFGPYFENKLADQVDKVSEQEDFQILEELNCKIDKPEWAKSLIETHISYNFGQQKHLKIGELERDRLDSMSCINNVIDKLISGYGASTETDLCVPYYKVINEN